VVSKVVEEIDFVIIINSMIFISCSFDKYTKGLADWIKSQLANNGIKAYLSGQMEARSLASTIKEKITSSEAMLVIITEKHSAWVQNEIGIAYKADVPIYALVQDYVLTEEGKCKKIQPEGILEYITIYERFDAYHPDTITSSIDKFIQKIQQSRKEKLLSTGALAMLAVVLLFLLTKRN